MDSELNSSAITIEIQRELAEVVRLRKADREDPRIKQILARIDELAKKRMNLATA